MVLFPVTINTEGCAHMQGNMYRYECSENNKMYASSKCFTKLDFSSGDMSAEDKELEIIIIQMKIIVMKQTKLKWRTTMSENLPEGYLPIFRYQMK